MEPDYPKYLYKYRPITNRDDLNTDYNIRSLIDCDAIFSSRKNFNDLFDSKIKLLKPTLDEMHQIADRPNSPIRDDIIKSFANGKFTVELECLLDRLEVLFNEMIDSYAFMSLSSISTSNLMWSHYADSHRGFCIEYKTEFLKAQKVSYADEIPELAIIDILKIGSSSFEDNLLADKIHAALRCKLIEWDYESEYRYIASKEMASISSGEKFKKVKYHPHWVESVIFGYRMSDETKAFIIKNLPSDTKFKQAKPGRNTMEIFPY